MSIKEKNTPIRVAQVVGKVVSAGVDVTIMNYYRNLDRQKVQFDFIIDGLEETPLDKEIVDLGGHIYKVACYDKNPFKNILQCYRIFRENKYVIVHSNINSLNVFPLMSAYLAGVKIRISHSHSTSAKGEGIKTFIKLILRPFSKIFATHYYACSEQAGRWLFGNRCVNHGKITFINNAIDVKKFTYNKEVREYTRKQLNLNDQLVIGHIGRFVYQKNHDFLVDIFAEIHKINPNSVLLLIGDGELLPHIQKKVQCLGLDSCILFLGIRQDIHALLQSMDVFVFPSYYEGFGMVAAESQSAGLPTLVADTLPIEVKITDLLEFFSLNRSVAQWAVEAINLKQKFHRSSRNTEITAAGYEISEAAKILENQYLDLYHYHFAKS